MDINKKEVLDFFKNHIIKYVVSDLEKLNKIEADGEGVGGCAIPQASSTFSALDLVGYLIHPQDVKEVDMSFTNLLKNKKYFPELSDYKLIDDFFDSFRSYVRTILAHRYLMTKYDIAKVNIDKLFFDDKGRTVFNVAFFTKISIEAIEKIYSDIKSGQFKIDSNTNEESIKMVKEKLNKLKSFDFKGIKNAELTGLMTINIPFETTKSISG